MTSQRGPITTRRSPSSPMTPSAAISRAPATRSPTPRRRDHPAMPRAEHTVTIDRPAADVFDYLADGTHNAEWRSGVLEISRTSPENGAGASYRQVLSG